MGILMQASEAAKRLNVPPDELVAARCESSGVNTLPMIKDLYSGESTNEQRVA